MTDYVVSPPPTGKVISLTKGTDCTFTLQRKDTTGNLVDWGADVLLDIDIDRSSPTQIAATVTTSDAAFRIESDTADTIRDGTAWRVVLSIAGTPSTESPLMVGSFARYDGGS